MNNPASAQNVTLLELAVLAAALALAVVLYFLWVRVLRTFRRPGKESVVSLISRISAPLIFLLVASGLRLDVLTSALRLSPRFSVFVNAAIIFLVVLLVIRLIDGALLYRYEKKRLSFPLPGVLHGFILILLYLIVLFAVLKGGLGVNITPFLATSAIFTAILGLAFQGVLSNLLAGISLNLTRSFSRGDWVKIGSHEGVILDTNWRETLMLDRYTNVVVIPNNTVASEMIVNFSRPDHKTALTIPLKVSAGAPPAAVLDALRQAAREVPEVITVRAPEAYIISYDDLGISYVVKFWVTDFARKHPITGDVARHIWYKFKRENIGVPIFFGEGIKHMVEAVAAGRGVESEDGDKERDFADLLHSSLLRYQEGEKAGQLLVPEDEVRRLGDSVRRQRYTGGEVLFRQGDKGESCYLVANGSVKGQIIYEEKGKRHVSEFRVEAGGIFGEMSLFTGMPRTATGIIEAEAELLEITAEDFALLMSRNPQLAEVIAELVSARNQKNADFLRKIKELSEQDIEAGTNPRSILERLKKLVSRFRRSE
ncbi:MAG TPA: mechanosensitive ion channel family protein [Candidatus Desulfaltia sp.]|nr:mechanosensitive ion channel family protein [Candidatus Desulfaltia sp.]